MSDRIDTRALMRRDDSLVMRNVRVGGRRTTVRMEQTYWDALDDVGRRARKSRDMICDEIYVAGGGKRLTANLRLFLLNYFRQTPDGRSDHADAATGPSAR